MSERLGAAAVDALVIKGPVTERWLYDAGEVRPLADVDVVVDPRRYEPAERVLLDAGFVNRYDGVAPDWAEEHADRWASSDWPLAIDLHRRLWGFDADPEQVWDQLWAERERMQLAGDRAIWIPSEPARLLLTALHAAHHRTAAKPIEDLRRAAERVERAVWRAAVELAGELGALEGLAAGVELAPDADAMRADLGLADVTPRMHELSSDLWSAAPTAAGFVRLAEAPGARAKLRFLRREIVPSARFMRQMSGERRLARRGRAGLLASYPVRWISLVRYAARGAVDAWALRRER